MEQRQMVSGGGPWKVTAAGLETPPIGGAPGIFYHRRRQAASAREEGRHDQT